MGGPHLDLPFPCMANAWTGGSNDVNWWQLMDAAISEMRVERWNIIVAKVSSFACSSCPLDMDIGSGIVGRRC